MRAIACTLLIGLFPALSQATIIEFNFKGLIDNEAAGGGTFWNNPGPEPPTNSTFRMTFDVNTLSPGNTVSYTFGPTSKGPSIETISADFVATDFTFTLNGKTVLWSPVGDFSFSGGPLGEFSFIGGGAGAGTNGVSFFFVPDFYLGTTLQSDLNGSSDPLGLLLNGSGFFTDTGDPSVVSFQDSRLGAFISGTGTAVPEPGGLALLLIAVIGLGFVHRRRVLGAIG